TPLTAVAEVTVTVSVPAGRQTVSLAAGAPTGSQLVATFQLPDTTATFHVLVVPFGQLSAAPALHTPSAATAPTMTAIVAGTTAKTRTNRGRRRARGVDSAFSN